METIYRDANGKSKLNLATQSAALGEGLTAYLVDVAPLKVTARGAQTLLADGDTPIMTQAPHGKGRVVALGDPWIYNEYINSKDNHQIAENLFVSVKTVEAHREHIKQKMGIKSSSELLRFAIEYLLKKG